MNATVFPLGIGFPTGVVKGNAVGWASKVCKAALADPELELELELEPELEFDAPEAELGVPELREADVEEEQPDTTRTLIETAATEATHRRLALGAICLNRGILGTPSGMQNRIAVPQGV